MLQQRGRGGAAAGARGRAGSGRRAGPRPQPYNRNKFLQANFRFLVSDAADLRRHEADADLMLDWDDVVQVHGKLLLLQYERKALFLTLKLRVNLPLYLTGIVQACH